MWDIIYPIGYFAPVNNPDIKTPENYYKKINEDLYERLGAADLLDIENETYYTFISEKDANYNDITKRRYLFVGNDRAVQDFNYPQTAAEVIRYIYNLIGLKTDNDYLTIPSSNTIYGLKNGLELLLGDFNDKFAEDYILPVYEIKYDADAEYLKIGYGNAGIVEWDKQLSEAAFNKINNSAWGPLYEAVFIDYIPAVEINSSNNKETIFNKTIATAYGDNIKIQYYEKIGEIYTEVSSYKENTDFYKAEIIYEKALQYDSTKVYYRNVNSLWSLLREFQTSRENYQPDWNIDNPISPKHIQNRPKIFFTTETERTFDLNDYIYWRINNTQIINSENLENDINQILKSENLGVVIEDKSNNKVSYNIYTAENADQFKFITGDSITYYQVNLQDLTEFTNNKILNNSIENKWNLIKISTTNKDSIFEWDEDEINLTTLKITEINSITEMMNEIRSSI